ncbi:MAG: hypothetical protein QM305_03905 [Bacteroidota bacterium]|nr:hypothetical protein [Bacteroidota bacterium]
MIKNKLTLFFALCVTLASVFSCKTDLDEPVDPNNGNDDPNDGNTELVVSAVIANWTSVKTMTDGTGGGGSQGFTPKWEKGDKIIGYYNNGTGDVQMTYEVNEVAVDGTARFKKAGTFQEPKNGETVYFVYAEGCQTSSITNGKLQINIQEQSKRTLPMLMSASGKVSDRKIALSFSSKMAVLGIKNPSLDGSPSIKITQLTVSGSGLIVEGTFDLKNGSFTLGKEPSYINVACDQEVGSEEMIFVSIFPGVTTDLELTITPQEAFVYSLSRESLTPFANYLYYFNAPVFTRSARYIAIDWDQDVSSHTFDVASGDIEIVFKKSVPPIKKNDVLIVPDQAEEYHIRIVSSATQTGSGGTLSLKTSEGKIGHLFKNCKFTLSTESGVTTRSPFNPVYTPSRVEIFNGDRYIPVYDITRSSGEMPKELFKWEKNMDNTPLWEQGPINLSWEQCSFDIGLKGTLEFDFGEVPWEETSMGELQYLSIWLEGGFNMNLALKIAATANANASKEFTLKEDIVKTRFTFVVGGVPLYVSVSSDLMAELSAAAKGEASISGGVNAEMTAKLGVEWTKGIGGKPIYELEKNLKLLGPSVNAHADVEGNVYTYPSIKIGLYSVLCPTINPKPYVKASAEARLVKNSYFGWNAGLSSGIDLDLDLNLDPFFIEKPPVEIDPINLFDLPIVTLPDALTLKTETPTQMKTGETKEIKYHATHKNHLADTTYNGAGMLVHFEAEGGTLDKEYAYTDSEGNAKVSFTLTDTEKGNVKAEIVLGDEGADKVKANIWKTEIINYRLTANPTTQFIDENGKAPITFKLEQYTSLTEKWSPVPGKTLTFTAVGGTCPASGVTTQDGTVDIVFSAEYNFNEGSVTAEFNTNEPVVWSGSVKAEITAKEEDQLKYVAIDWEQDVSSHTFDVASGDIEIVFKKNVPRLKKNNVLIVPDQSGEYHIRIISYATQTGSGGTLSLKTSEGKMGHLFKNCKFTLSTESGVMTRSPFNPVYMPSRVEIFNGEKYIPLYDMTINSGWMARELFKWEKNMNGTKLWEQGPLSISWEQCTFNIGLKGTFDFDFGEVPWEETSMGELQHLSICLEGGFNMNLALKIAATAGADVSKEFTLKEEIVKTRFTFMVGAVPVYVSVSSDLMAELSAAAEGEASISGGVIAGMTAKLGVEWDKNIGGKPIYELEKNLGLIGPSVNAHADVEGNVYTYPSIKIGLYSVLCPTINPKPYVKAAADARSVDNSYWGWNAGLSTGIDLDIDLNLDPFFVEKTQVEIEPINLFDMPIVTLPDSLTLKTETPTQMKTGETKEIKYHATNKNHLTGNKYNATGILVHFEAKGGTLDKEYAYTDSEGNVKVSFTLTDTKEGNVKAKIVLGDGEADKIEADLWEAGIINYRLTADPTTQFIDENGKAAITFKLEQYTSLTEKWSPVPGKTLTFTAVGGTCPASGVTTQDGTVDIIFSAEYNFNEGSVTAAFNTNEPIVWSGSVIAEITAKEDDQLKYIDIDWEQDVSSQTFDVVSGDIEIVFKENVPRIKKNDVLIVPDQFGDYHIRLVSSVTQTRSGGTLSLKTSEGKMGHLFKNCKFTLSTESGVTTRSSFNPVYTPSRVEIFDGHKYIPVYGRTRSSEEMSKELFKWEKNMDGTTLWEQGPLSLSWEQCNFDIGLKGTFEFDFGEVPWEEASVGDLQHLSIYLEGGFNMNLALRIAATAGADVSKEFTLKEDIVKTRFTFMVGAVPVYVSVASDLMAELSAAAEGEASISGGVSAGMTAKFGVEWDKDTGGKPIYGIERNLELISPSVDAHAHLEGGIYTYPSIKIGLYSVLCPTINPKPYVKAAADARLVDNSYLGWNAGLSTGIELDLALNLDLFFIETPLVEIDPVNLFDLPIVALPDVLNLETETPTQMKTGETKEIKYHATNKNYLTSNNYNAAGMLVHFEAEGGTLDKEYAYTDSEGNVNVSFTLTSTDEGNVKAEIVLGDEEADQIEAELWEAEIINFRLTANPTSQILPETGKAPITFKLEMYSSLTGEWSPVKGKTLTFTAVGGSCPASGVTAPDGTVDITFTAEDDFTEGSVTAEFKTNLPVVWGGSVKAEITAPEEEDDSNEGQLKKAKKMKENVVRIGSQEVEIVKGELDYVKAKREDDGSIGIEWCKEKYPELVTIHFGVMNGFTENMLGQMIETTSSAWSNLHIGFMHITNPEAASWEDWKSISFYKDDIANGAILFARSSDGNYYTMQFYIQLNDGVQLWANLKATRSNP